jgi:aconitate hydratase
MGVLPLNFADGENAAVLGLDGSEVYDIDGLLDGAEAVAVTARRADGTQRRFTARVRINTPVEWAYYRHGGVLPYMLRQMAA